jgi:putative ABC transport system ATP-binding protein
MPMMLAGISPKERQQRVNRALESVDLVDRAQHRPDQLSGGQRQRVAIARATIMQPNVLLADEPTGNLDRASGIEIVKLLEGLNQQGVTLILITHDRELGDRAGRQIHIVDGSIV